MPKNQFTRPPFDKILSSHDPPFSGKENEHFSLLSRNFCPNFSSQSQFLLIFSSQDPTYRGKNQFSSPTLRKWAVHPLDCNLEGWRSGRQEYRLHVSHFSRNFKIYTYLHGGNLAELEIDLALEPVQLFLVVFLSSSIFPRTWFIHSLS